MSMDARGHYLFGPLLRDYGYFNRNEAQRSFHAGMDLMSPHPIKDAIRLIGPDRQGALDNLIEVASAERPDGSSHWSHRIRELANAYSRQSGLRTQFRTNNLAMLIREMMGNRALRGLVHPHPMVQPRTSGILRTEPVDSPRTLAAMIMASALEHSSDNPVGSGLTPGHLKELAQVFQNNDAASGRVGATQELAAIQEAQGKDLESLLREYDTPEDLIQEIKMSVQDHSAYKNPDRPYASLYPSVREGGVFRANVPTNLGTVGGNQYAGTGSDLERLKARQIAAAAYHGGYDPYSTHNLAGQQYLRALPFRYGLRGLGSNDYAITDELTKIGRAVAQLASDNPHIPPEELYLRLLQGDEGLIRYLGRLPGNKDTVSPNPRDNRGRLEVNVPPPPSPVQGPETSTFVPPQSVPGDTLREFLDSGVWTEGELQDPQVERLRSAISDLLRNREGVDAQSMGLARRKAFDAPDIEGDVDTSQLRAPLEGPFIRDRSAQMSGLYPPPEEAPLGDPSSEWTSRQEDMTRGGTGVQTFPVTSPTYPELPPPKLSREDLNPRREPAGRFEGRTPDIKGSPAKAVLFSNLSQAGSDLLNDMGANQKLIEGFMSQDPDGQAKTLQAFFQDELDEIANRGAQEEGRSRSPLASPVRQYRRRYEDAYQKWMSLYDKTREVEKGRFSPLEPPPSNYQGPNQNKVLTGAERQRQDRYENRPGYAPGNPGGRMSDSVEPLVTPFGKSAPVRSMALNSPNPELAIPASKLLEEGSRRGTQTDWQKQATGDVLSLMGKGPVDPNSKNLVDEILRKFYSEKELNEASLKNITGTFGERLGVSRRLTKKAAEVSSVNRFFADLYDPKYDDQPSYKNARDQIRGIIDDPEMSPDAKRRAAHRIFKDVIGQSPFFKNVPTHIDDKGRLERGGSDIPPRPNLRVVKRTPEGYEQSIGEASKEVAQSVAPPRGQAGAMRQHRGTMERSLHAQKEGPFSLEGQGESTNPLLEDPNVTGLPDAIMHERRDILLRWLKKNATDDGYVNLPKSVADRLKKTPKKLEQLVRLARSEGLILRIDGKPLIPASVVRPGPKTRGEGGVSETDRQRHINQADPGRNAKLPAFTSRMNDPGNVRAAFLHMVKGKEDMRGALANLLRSIKKDPEGLMIKLRRMGVQIWDPEVMLEVGVGIVRNARKQGARLTSAPRAGTSTARGGGATGGGTVIPRGR